MNPLEGALSSLRSRLSVTARLLLALCLIATPTHTSAQNPLTEAPKISVKVSTSVVQSAINAYPNTQGTLQVPGGQTAASLPDGGRLQRSTLAANLSGQQVQFLSAPQKLQAVQFKSQDSSLGREERHQIVRTQEMRQQVPLAGNQFNVDGKILEQPSYRRSVSTSLNLSPLDRQQWHLHHSHPQSSARNSDQPRDSKSNKFFGSLNELDFKCQGRAVGKILRHTKNLLIDGYVSLERYATPVNVALGSSLLAGAVPLVAFMLPDSRKRRAGVDYPAPKFSLQARVDSMIGWIERSIEHLPNFPRLHPQECFKRSICEAHNQPNKYGAIGFVLRLFFPASNFTSTDRMDDMEYKVINKYRHAAGFGLNKRIESNGTNTVACKEKYEDCLVSLLDVSQSLLDIFLK